MYRETVAPIYIRVSHAQPVKAAHGVDDREAEPTRQAEISYAVFCLKKKHTSGHVRWTKPRNVGDAAETNFAPPATTDNIGYSDSILDLHSTRPCHALRDEAEFEKG